MARPWSLGHPHPEHVPTVTSVPALHPAAKQSWRNTALSCSCGAGPARVSVATPSQGGRLVAEAAYKLHVEFVLYAPEAEPAFGEPPCL